MLPAVLDNVELQEMPRPSRLQLEVYYPSSMSRQALHLHPLLGAEFLSFFSEYLLFQGTQEAFELFLVF